MIIHNGKNVYLQCDYCSKAILWKVATDKYVKVIVENLPLIKEWNVLWTPFCHISVVCSDETCVAQFGDVAKKVVEQNDNWVIKMVKDLNGTRAMIPEYERGIVDIDTEYEDVNEHDTDGGTYVERFRTKEDAN